MTHKGMTPKEKFVEIINRVSAQLGRGVVDAHPNFPSISFFPLGKVSFYKGEPRICDCWDDEARFLIRDIWAAEGIKESEESESKNQERSSQEDYFFGAADEESF